MKTTFSTAENIGEMSSQFSHDCSCHGLLMTRFSEATLSLRRDDLKISVISPLAKDAYKLDYRAARRDRDTDDFKFTPQHGNLENLAYSGVLVYERPGQKPSKDDDGDDGWKASPAAGVIFCDRNYTDRCILTVYKSCRNVTISCKICNVLAAYSTPCDAIYRTRRDCDTRCCRLQNHLHDEAMKYKDWHLSKKEEEEEPPAFLPSQPPNIKSELAIARAARKFRRSDSCRASKLFFNSDSEDEEKEKEIAGGKPRRVKSKYVSSSSDEDEESEAKKMKEEAEVKKGDDGAVEAEKEKGEKEKEKKQEEEREELMPSQVMKDEEDEGEESEPGQAVEDGHDAGSDEVDAILAGGPEEGAATGGEEGVFKCRGFTLEGELADKMLRSVQKNVEKEEEDKEGEDKEKDEKDGEDKE